MYRIIEESGTGKTSRLMLLAKENDAVFVCNNPNAMEYKASKYGITGIHFISYGDFYTHRRDYENKKYVIDELEHFLDTCIFQNTELVGYTLTIE